MNPKNNKVDCRAGEDQTKSQIENLRCQSGQEEEMNYDEKIVIDADPQEVLEAIFRAADSPKSESAADPQDGDEE